MQGVKCVCGTSLLVSAAHLRRVTFHFSGYFSLKNTFSCLLAAAACAALRVEGARKAQRRGFASAGFKFPAHPHLVTPKAVSNMVQYP